MTKTKNGGTVIGEKKQLRLSQKNYIRQLADELDNQYKKWIRLVT